MIDDPQQLFVAVTAIALCIQVLADADGRPAKRQRVAQRNRGQRLVWRYDELSDFEFYRNYRMSKQQFRDLVARLRAAEDGGEPILRGVSKKSKARQKAGSGAAVCPEIQLSMTLRYLAGGSYLDIMRIHKVSKACFNGTIKRVIKAIIVSGHGLVCFGVNEEGEADVNWLTRIARQFQQKTRGVIWGCIGAVDGIVLKIKCPPMRAGPAAGSAAVGGSRSAACERQRHGIHTRAIT